MSEYGLPCVVCGKQLRNVMPEADNQPNDGVYLETQRQEQRLSPSDRQRIDPSEPVLLRQRPPSDSP